MFAKRLIALAFIIQSIPLFAPDAQAIEDYNQQLANAHVLIKNRHVYAARELLQKMIAKPDAPAQAYNMLAESYLETAGLESDTKGLKDAIAGLSIALKKDPENGLTYRLLAYDCNERADYLQAVRYATKALQVKKPDIISLKQRAIAYSHLKKDQAAINDMQSLLRQGFPSAVNYMLLGDMQRGLGLYKDAAESYSLGLRSKEGFQARIFNELISSLELSNQMAKALVLVSDRLKIDSDNPELLDTSARLKVKNNDLNGALQDLNKAIAAADIAIYYRHRADLYTKMGKKDLAKMDMTKAGARDRTNFFP